MTIPFLDLKSPYVELQDDLDESYRRLMTSGWYILGEEVESFEAEYATFCEAPYCVGVGNGLEALHLALRAFEIGAGDEVIVPSNTYIATWLAISYAGAVPVPVEPDIDSMNIDPSKIESVITTNTKCIMPVHLYGNMAEMNTISEIAKKHGLIVIDDAAQAHGARYCGQRAGSLAHATTFSFYPGKNLGAFGDAGAVVTHNESAARQIEILRNYGSPKKYFNETKGYNSRLDPIQAAFLKVKLKHLDAWNQRRQIIADFYQSQLCELKDFKLPSQVSHIDHVWHLFVVSHPDRDRLQAYLKSNGVGTLIHYPIPPHLSEAYQDLGYQTGDLPIAEQLANQVLSLPIGPHLSMKDAETIVELIKRF